MKKEEILSRRLEREKKASKVLEEVLEKKSRDLYGAYEYFQKIFDSLEVAILIVDTNGLIKISNYFAKNIFGEESLSNDIFSLIKNMNNQFEFSFPKDSKSWEGLDFELELKNQKINIPLNVNISKLKDFEGEFIFHFKDLREQRKRDEKVRTLQSRLIKNAFREGVAESAVAVLHNIGNVLTSMIGKINDEEKLQNISMSKNILEKISDSIDSYSSADELANFFKNDQKGIKVTQILKEIGQTLSRSEDDLKDSFKFLKEKTNHIASIIQIQQKYANFKERDKSKVSISEVLENCYLLVKDNIEKRNIHFNADIMEDLFVYSDSVGLAQVLSNALTNAIESIDDRFKHDPEFQKASIKVKAIKTNDNVELVFCDTGRGFCQEISENLFKYGFSTKERGSGFGLNSSASFIRGNKGEIKLTSSGLNKGATLTITLPCYIDSNENVTAQ